MCIRDRCTLVCLTAFILALGTDLHWVGSAVMVDVPSCIQKYYSYAQTIIPLPGYFLFRYLPFYANMRVWMRYGVFVVLFLSLLAGIGVAWLLRQMRAFLKAPVAVAVLILVLVDFYQGPQSLSQVQGRPVDVWLAKQPGGGTVVQFPFWQVTLPQQTYYTLIHNKPFVGGFFAAFGTSQFQRIQPILESFPDTESIELLRELGVRWVIVDSRKYADFEEIQNEIESMDLRIVGIFDSQYVYELR